MSEPAATPLETDCQAVQEKQQAGAVFLLLDCRKQDEWDHVHIAGATLVPMSEIAGRLGELQEHRGGEVVVYCHHGGRSLRVARFLREQGFAKAQSMAGGIDAWAEIIDPSLPRY
jgi:rhodanese-related sulfurtransferase